MPYSSYFDEDAKIEWLEDIFANEADRRGVEPDWDYFQEWKDEIINSEWDTAWDSPWGQYLVEMGYRSEDERSDVGDTGEVA